MDTFEPVDEREGQLFEKFKLIMADEDPDDKKLMRFLRARQHDLTKAEEMLRSSIKWRKEYDVDSYKSWVPPSVLRDDYNIICDHTGYDHQDRPTFYIPLGSYLGKECVEDGWKDDLFKFVFFALEKGLSILEECEAATVTVVVDMANLRMKQVIHVESMMILYKAFGFLEANYPEVLKQVFIVNAPWVFTMAYNFFKPILSKATIDKVQVQGSIQEKWLPTLLDKMPLESIPCASLRIPM
jgi:hypothetical protein